MCKGEFLTKLKKLEKRRTLVHKDTSVVANAKNVTDVYMDYLLSLENTNLTDLKAYDLLNHNIRAITELYRICLFRSFGMRCEFTVKYESLQVFIPSCITALEDSIFSIEYKSDSEKVLFIQGCLRIMAILERRMEDYLYAN